MTKPISAIAIHGGAGTIDPKDMTPEKEAAYREALRQAAKSSTEINAFVK